MTTLYPSVDMSQVRHCPHDQRAMPIRGSCDANYDMSTGLRFHNLSYFEASKQNLTVYVAGESVR